MTNTLRLKSCQDGRTIADIELSALTFDNCGVRFRPVAPFAMPPNVHWAELLVDGAIVGHGELDPSAELEVSTGDARHSTLMDLLRKKLDAA